jgi:hypothetical protein
MANPRKDNAMTSTTLPLIAKALQDSDVLTFFSMPEPNRGPIVLIYDVATEHPGANIDGIFAAGAVLTQAGIPLLGFSACAHETLQKLEIVSAKERDVMKDIPDVGTAGNLRSTFSDFLLLCWKLAWNANPDLHLPGKGPTAFHDLFTTGRFLIVRSGLLEHVETSFLHGSCYMMVDMDVREILESPYTTPSIHPFGKHALSALLAGMGYQPGLPDGKVFGVLGTTSGYPHPGKSAAAMAKLFWAAKHRDPRLDPFRIHGW